MGQRKFRKSKEAEVLLFPSCTLRDEEMIS